MRGISIGFPGVKALDGVDFRLFPGEVHALMGENGAGKSTLIKALTGVYGIDAGTITLAGEQVSFSGPAQAQAAGISTVYQEVNLCRTCRWPRTSARPRAAPLRPHRLARDAPPLGRAARGLNLDIDPAVAARRPLARRPAARRDRPRDRRHAKVLILDEPTSSLDADEVAELFRVIRSLKEQGVAILFVSHFLDQVYEISDRITVLRNGQLVGEYLVEELPASTSCRR